MEYRTLSHASPLHSACYRDINRAFQSLSDLSSVRQCDAAPVPVVEPKQPEIAAAPPWPLVQEPEAECVQYSSGSDSDADEGGAAARERESALLQAQAALGRVSGASRGDPSGEEPPRGLTLKLPLHSLQQQSE